MGPELNLRTNDAQPDFHHVRLQAGDPLLLCTDRLPNMIRPESIAQCLAESPSAQAAGDRLLDLALQGGGKVNVTVVLARTKPR